MWKKNQFSFYKMAAASKWVLLHSVARKVIFQQQRRDFMHRTLDYLKTNEMVKVMPGGSVESRRYVLKRDAMGYSMHFTVINKDSQMYIHYKNHQESVMCVKGSLELEVSKTFFKSCSTSAI